MTHPLFDARTLAQMADFFAQTVTIQQATEGQDADGGVTQAWANLAGHVDLACCVWQPTGKAGGSEVRLPDGTFLMADYFVLIKAPYTSITEKMRAISGGVTLDILLVDLDSQNLATKLTCQLIR